MKQNISPTPEPKERMPTFNTLETHLRKFPGIDSCPIPLIKYFPGWQRAKQNSKPICAARRHRAAEENNDAVAQAEDATDARRTDVTPRSQSMCARVSCRGRSNSYTKEKALFALSNHSRCVAMAAASSLPGSWCTRALFTQAVVQHYFGSCSFSPWPT